MMARDPIYAAGGIVLRGGPRGRIAVVRRSKDDHWVLPRGKLKRDEDPLVGARREVVEETGHRVQVHEFVGAITYMARGRPKVVQFWRMQAAERPSRDLTPDITEVEWLPIGAAIRRLSFPLEKLFLRHVGRRLLRRRRRKLRRKAAAPARKSTSKKSPSRKSATKSRVSKTMSAKKRSANTRRHKTRSVHARTIKVTSAMIAAPPRPPSEHHVLPPVGPMRGKGPNLLRRILGRL
jgi:8-oxo-dGTP diphosphatase